MLLFYTSEAGSVDIPHSKVFCNKIAKMHYFSQAFKKILKPCVNFSHVLDEKYKLLGKLEKNLKYFEENSMEKLNF